MIKLIPRGQKEIFCNNLNEAITCAKDCALINGFADIIQDNKVLFTYYTLPDKLEIFEIIH